MRSGWSSGSICWVLLVSGRFAVSPNHLSPKHRSTFLPLQHTATLISSVDWGLGWRCASGFSTMNTEPESAAKCGDNDREAIGQSEANVCWANPIGRHVEIAGTGVRRH